MVMHSPTRPVTVSVGLPADAGAVNPSMITDSVIGSRSSGRTISPATANAMTSGRPPTLGAALASRIAWFKDPGPVGLSVETVNVAARDGATPRSRATNTSATPKAAWASRWLLGLVVTSSCPHHRAIGLTPHRECYDLQGREARDPFS